MSEPFNIVDQQNMLKHIKIMIDNLESMVEYFKAIPVMTPCMNCTFFEAGKCKKWNSDIPEDVISVGCPEFFYNANSHY